MCLSEEMADTLSARFAAAHWIKCSDGAHYCEAPASTRGIPHSLVAGVHACLDEYLEALETLRASAGREDAPTVDSLVCLPFGPWSQAQPPVIEATADLSMRLCVRDPSLMSMQSGHAYLPDSTPKEEAVIREPLFRRPCQASVSDNPFATSYEHMDSFFNLANGIVLTCRTGVLMESATEGSAATDVMMARVNAWVTAEPSVIARSCSACADILLMLSMMYPQKHGIAEEIVLPVWAEAVPALHRKLQEQRAAGEVEQGAPLAGLGLAAELVDQGRLWWAAFVRTGGRGAWNEGPLGELLRLLDDHDGSHAVTREQFGRVRSALERSVQAAWLVASPDGVQPPLDPEHPASEASEPKKVRRPIIDPVFVGDKKRGVRQRGCLVGLKPHQLRQVCALACGAHLPEVKCQVSRNEGACFLEQLLACHDSSTQPLLRLFGGEHTYTITVSGCLCSGGLSLRVSSAADILDDKGQERSAKSISPVRNQSHNP